MPTSRLNYLDYAKGLGILLVIWAHINSSGPIPTFLYFFHMPLFFFISGMLFSKKRYNSFGTFVQRKGKTLLKPYVIYSVVTWAIWCIYNLAVHNDVESYWMPLLQTVIAQGSQGYLVHNTALWFVPCLFAITLIFYALDNLPIWMSGIVCFGMAALNMFFVSLWGDTYAALPWNLDTGFMALPFFWAGKALVTCLSHDGLQKLVLQRKFISVAVFAALVAFLCLNVYYGAPRISMGHSNYGNNIVMFYVRAFAGTLALIIFAILMTSWKKDFCTTRYMEWAGRQSFDFMSLNVPIKGFLIVFIAKLMHIDQLAIWTSCIYSIVPFILTVLAVSIITLLVNRYIRKR